MIYFHYFRKFCSSELTVFIWASNGTELQLTRRNKRQQRTLVTLTVHSRRHGVSTVPVHYLVVTISISSNVIVLLTERNEVSKRKHGKFNIAIKSIYFFCIYDNRPWRFFRCQFFVSFGWTFAYHFLGRVHRIFSLSRCRKRRRLFMPPRICSSFQNREEPLAHFEKRFCLFFDLLKG